MDFPPIGLGTAHWDDHEAVADAVATALEAGYRHVDTAQAYGNEAAVGAGLARADVERSDVLLATKVHEDRLSYDDVIETAERSRDRLDVDVIDLLYVHTPRRQGAYDARETLPAFDELRERGVIRHVGVGNFTPALLDEATDVLESPLYAHQVEMHPLLPQEHLLERARRDGHHLVAHTPLVRGAVADVPAIVDVARKHDASSAQVSLAWLVEKGGIPIPGAVRADYLQENYGALDLQLDADDVARIGAIDSERRVCDWDDGPWNWAT
jgi:diketogulonate reductase-like aldo/keto reductase